MKKLIAIVFVSILSTSCAELKNIATQVGEAAVSNNEDSAGLKSALNVGVNYAVSELGKENGFLGNSMLKLMLPPEAQPIIDNISIIPGGKELVSKAVLALNRSAEDAVKEAGPIFGNAITSMSIMDATNILFGDKDAATKYLRQSTFKELSEAFSPKVKKSLDKPLMAGVSTTECWSTLASGYNLISDSFIGEMKGLKPIDVDLDKYVTEKTLDALFTKVAEEELKIRTDPSARVNSLLKSVFGKLDNK